MSGPRLFAALPLPDDVRERLAAVGRELAGALPAGRARAVPPANLHLTLRFFGSGVPVEAMKAGLERALPSPAGPLHVTPRAVSAFPSLRRARTVIAACEESGPPRSRLAALQQAAERAAAGVGLPAEPRPFRPHVTLLRLRRPAPLSSGAASRCRLPETFPVTRLELLASTLTPAGAEYRVLAEFPLAASAEAPPTC